MGLNPVQFGNDVIEQFGRFLKGSFPIIDDNLRAQFSDKLRVGVHTSIRFVHSADMVVVQKRS